MYSNHVRLININNYQRNCLTSHGGFAMVMLFGKKVRMKQLKLTLLALPFLVIVFLFAYVPLWGWSFAFFRYIPGISMRDQQFVGWDNFRFIIQDRANVLRVLRNTLIFSSLWIVGISTVPIALAIMLSEVGNKLFRRLVQTVTTIPHFISWVVVFAFAFSLFAHDGIINRVFLHFNLIDSPTQMLQNFGAVYIFQTLLALWKSAGWNAIIYFAAIAGIDQELYEAAAIDGAGRFRRILYITLPGIKETWLVLFLLNVSAILSSNFDQYLLFMNPVVSQRLQVLDYYIYRVGLLNQDFGYATAIGIIRTFISLIILFSVNTIAKKVRGKSLI